MDDVEVKAPAVGVAVSWDEINLLGLKSASDIIRFLSRIGYQPAPIAEFLDVRYQHVRNVLIQRPKKKVTLEIVDKAVERYKSPEWFGSVVEKSWVDDLPIMQEYNGLVGTAADCVIRDEVELVEDEEGGFMEVVYE